MKTTIVPAQITSVEDKIAGNLSFTQLLLLVTPIFIGGASFVFLPAFLTYEAYKVVIIGILAFICFSLALRIRSKLILEWLVIAIRYNQRPRVYVFNKNSVACRDIPKVRKLTIQESVDVKPKEKLAVLPSFQASEVLAFESIIADPRADFHFTTTRKGVLNVNIKEVE